MTEFNRGAGWKYATKGDAAMPVPMSAAVV